MEILEGFLSLPKISFPLGGREDDVFVDRLNYKYTNAVLLVSSFTITYKILQSSHIQCWVPAILSRYKTYINTYCWISNTYYVSFKEQTTSLTNKNERMIKYYQWVPLIFLTLALSFLIPRLVYRFLSKQSGIDLLNVADASLNYMSVDKFDKRRKILTYLSNTIHFYASCNKSKRIKRGYSGDIYKQKSSTRFYLYDLMCCYGKFSGSYLTFLYMATKISYLINNIVQLFLLNVFLGFDYNSQGFYLLRNLTHSLFDSNEQATTSAVLKSELPQNHFLSQPIFGNDISFGHDVQISPLYGSVFGSGPTPVDLSAPTLLRRYFPLESACDFRIRMTVDSMVHNFTVNCVLPINLFNEQLFTFLWIWLWCLFFINLYDIFNWSLRIMPRLRYQYILHRIRFRYQEMPSKRVIHSFIYDYLSLDGVFVLRLLSLNASDPVTYDIIQILWQNYTDIVKYNRKLSLPIVIGNDTTNGDTISRPRGTNNADNNNETERINNNTEENDFTTNNMEDPFDTRNFSNFNNNDM